MSRLQKSLTNTTSKGSKTSTSHPTKGIAPRISWARCLWRCHDPPKSPSYSPVKPPNRASFTNWSWQTKREALGRPQIGTICPQILSWDWPRQQLHHQRLQLHPLEVLVVHKQRWCHWSSRYRRRLLLKANLRASDRLRRATRALILTKVPRHRSAPATHKPRCLPREKYPAYPSSWKATTIIANSSIRSFKIPVVIGRLTWLAGRCRPRPKSIISCKSLRPSIQSHWCRKCQLDQLLAATSPSCQLRPKTYSPSI